nr:Chain A, Muscarinic toxin-like protein 3 homolog [Ophiophagus hannah]3HH7_B Chain B, Muscarinic toxin-like protein 3 homolog [Ophiophagus hannah]
TKCYNHQSTTPETTEICPDSGYFCYKSSWIDGREGRIERGCTFTCPELTPNGKYVYCCRRDKCNQ